MRQDRRRSTLPAAACVGTVAEGGYLRFAVGSAGNSVVIVTITGDATATLWLRAAATKGLKVPAAPRAGCR